MSENNPILVELKRIEGQLAETLGSQTEEIKKAGETSTATARKLGELEGKYDALQADIKGRIEELEAKGKRLGLTGEGERKSFGQQFTDSPEFKDGLSRAGLKHFKVELKALTGAADSMGVMTEPQRLGMYTAPREATRIRDLMAQGRTSSDSLKFPQIKTWTNAAAPVYDRPTSAQVLGSGGLKPESDLAVEDKTFDVHTIAHLLRVHKNILSDVPALRSIIDNKMMEGLDEALDYQLIKGDGTGNNVDGLLKNAKVFTRYNGGDTKLDVLRRSLTDLRAFNFRPDAYVLNPFDWEDIELLKGTDARYVWVSVVEGGQPRVWRTPVVDTQAIDEGQFLVGAFRQVAQWFDREQGSVEAFEQDRDNVARNLITLRAELRGALVIYDQNGLVKGTYEDPTP